MGETRFPLVGRFTFRDAEGRSHEVQLDGIQNITISREVFANEALLHEMVVAFSNLHEVSPDGEETGDIDPSLWEEMILKGVK